jgi:hypothetical protein
MYKTWFKNTKLRKKSIKEKIDLNKHKFWQF